MNQNINIVTLLFTSIILISSCSIRTSGNNQNNPISGVVMWNGQSMSEIEIIIRNEDGTEIERTISDKNGCYSFDANKLKNNFLYKISKAPEMITSIPDYFENHYNCTETIRYSSYGINKDIHLFKLNLKLISPIDRGRINNTNPLIQWESYPDAYKYQIAVVNSANEVLVRDQSVSNNEYQIAANLVQDEEYSVVINAINTEGNIIASTFNASFTVGALIEDKHLQGFVRWNGQNQEGVSVEVRDYYTFQEKLSTSTNQNGFYSIDYSTLMDDRLYIMRVDAPSPFDSNYEFIKLTNNGQHINLTLFKEEQFIKKLYDFCRIDGSNPFFEWYDYPEATNYKIFITETDNMKSVLFKDNISNNFYQSLLQLQKNIEYKLIVKAYRSSYLLAESSVLFSIGEPVMDNYIDGVVLLNGLPLENVTVNAFDNIYINNNLYDSAVTNIEGQFSLHLPYIDQYSDIVLCIDETGSYHSYIDENSNYTPMGIFKVINLKIK